jgi:hypothetical protein
VAAGGSSGARAARAGGVVGGATERRPTRDEIEETENKKEETNRFKYLIFDGMLLPPKIHAYFRRPNASHQK